MGNDLRAISRPVDRAGAENTGSTRAGQPCGGGRAPKRVSQTGLPVLRQDRSVARKSGPARRPRGCPAARPAASGRLAQGPARRHEEDAAGFEVARPAGDAVDRGRRARDERRWARSRAKPRRARPPPAGDSTIDRRAAAPRRRRSRPHRTLALRPTSRARARRGAVVEEAEAAAADLAQDRIEGGGVAGEARAHEVHHPDRAGHPGEHEGQRRRSRGLRPRQQGLGARIVVGIVEGLHRRLHHHLVRASRRGRQAA